MHDISPLKPICQHSSNQFKVPIEVLEECPWPVSPYQQLSQIYGIQSLCKRHWCVQLTWGICGKIKKRTDFWKPAATKKSNKKSFIISLLLRLINISPGLTISKGQQDTYHFTSMTIYVIKVRTLYIRGLDWRICNSF